MVGRYVWWRALCQSPRLPVKLNPRHGLDYNAAVVRWILTVAEVRRTDVESSTERKREMYILVAARWKGMNGEGLR